MDFCFLSLGPLYMLLLQLTLLLLFRLDVTWWNLCLDLWNAVRMLFEFLITHIQWYIPVLADADADSVCTRVPVLMHFAEENVHLYKLTLFCFSLSRYKLKFSPDKVDTMIVQAICKYFVHSNAGRELDWVHFFSRMNHWILCVTYGFILKPQGVVNNYIVCLFREGVAC